MPKNINNITMTNGYNVIKPKINLEWSSAYMAKTNEGTGDCGKIIPVFIKELIPGQTVDLTQTVSIQFTPFMTNLLHEMTGELITMAVPYRICAFMRPTETQDDDTKEEADQIKWENFITGGKNGQDNQTLEQVALGQIHDNMTSIIGSLADYFGMPTDISNSANEKVFANKLPFNAYNLIYNKKLRNPDYTPWKKMKVSTNSDYDEVYGTATAYWNADRFTRARKMQQRGITPSIPIDTSLIQYATEAKIINTNADVKDYSETNLEIKDYIAKKEQSGQTDGRVNVPRYIKNSDGSITIYTPGSSTEWGTQNGKFGYATQLGFETEQSGTGSARLNLNELLTALGILTFETNMARTMPRLTDFLQTHYGIVPQDSRFQEPEWLSSHSFGIGINTVTATATTTSGTGNTYQGNITSQGWGAGSGMKTEYKAQEHCIVMTLMIIKPKGVYEGGLQRQWWGDRNRFDFPLPELVNLPDQFIKKGELRFTGTEDDLEEWGWEQVFDEYRSETNQVCGKLRPSEANNGGLPTYTLARYWTKDNAPELNDNFLKCNPDMARIKQYTNQPDFLFFIKTEIRTAMPIPLVNEPVNLGIN